MKQWYVFLYSYSFEYVVYKMLAILLTHWGRVTHICVGNLTIIGSDNGLSPGRRQAIIWTNAGILLIRTLGTNFSEIFTEVHTFSFKKMHLKMSSAKWHPFCPGFYVLMHPPIVWSSLLYKGSHGLVTSEWCIMGLHWDDERASTNKSEILYFLFNTLFDLSEILIKHYHFHSKYIFEHTICQLFY